MKAPSNSHPTQLVPVDEATGVSSPSPIPVTHSVANSYMVPAHPPGHATSHPSAVNTVAAAAGHSTPQGCGTVTMAMHCGRMHVEQTEVVDVIVGQAVGMAVVVVAVLFHVRLGMLDQM